MHPDTRNIWENMREFSFNILGRAIFDCTFNEMFSPFSHTLGVVQAVHGAEVLIKSRIAKENPLLIFEKLPKASSGEDLLTIKPLLKIV